MGEVPDLMAALERSLIRARRDRDEMEADTAEMDALVGNAWSYDHGWGLRSHAQRREAIERVRKGRVTDPAEGSA